MIQKAAAEQVNMQLHGEMGGEAKIIKVKKTSCEHFRDCAPAGVLRTEPSKLLPYSM